MARQAATAPVGRRLRRRSLDPAARPNRGVAL